MVVIGGHGRTGILIVEKLVAAGHEVLATIRNPKHMADLVKRGAETIVLDLAESSIDDFVIAFRGADAVVFAAGSAAGETSELDNIGTRRSVRATKNAGIKRYLSISAIGASTGLTTRGMSDEMKDYYKQKRLAAGHIHRSGLDWTILEPGELIDEPAAGKVTLSEDALEETFVTREDVAEVAVALLFEKKAAGHTYQLTRGKTPIATAVKKVLR